MYRARRWTRPWRQTKIFRLSNRRYQQRILLDHPSTIHRDKNCLPKAKHRLHGVPRWVWNFGEIHWFVEVTIFCFLFPECREVTPKAAANMNTKPKVNRRNRVNLVRPSYPFVCHYVVPCPVQLCKKNMTTCASHRENGCPFSHYVTIHLYKF